MALEHIFLIPSTYPDYEAIQNAPINLLAPGPQYPGTFEHYVASIIHEWQETEDDRLKTLADALHALGLTGQVGTKKIDDTRIELQVGSPSVDDRTR